MTDFPWAAGSATGIGSLPGTDGSEAQRLLFGELPDLPHLAELPARGPGADMIGRSAGLLVDLPVQVYAGRWQVAPRPGRDLRRTADLLERDLDEATALGEGFAGTFKIQSAGPWTLASSVDLPIGGRLLRDPGAVRDMTGSLAEGLRRHVADVRRRLPHATVLLQLDEPCLPAVVAGRIPTESGLSAYPAVDAPDAATALRSIVEAVAVPVVLHSCAPDLDLGLVRQAGVRAIALDLSYLSGAAALDALGEALDAGLGLFGGGPGSRGRAVAPAGGRGSGAPAGGPDSAVRIAERLTTLWKRLGFAPALLPRQVVVAPACGLAGSTPTAAREILTECREAGRRLAEA